MKRVCEIISESSSVSSRNIGLFFVVLLLSFALFLNGYYIRSQFTYVKPFEYLTGKVTRDEYIDRYRLEYPVMRFINGNLPQDAKIMFFFIGRRGYYCDREYMFDMKDYRGTSSLFREVVENSETPEEVLRKLHALKITHLLINHTIFDEWAQTQFDEETFHMLRTFFKEHIELLFYENDHGLSRLKSLSG